MTADDQRMLECLQQSNLKWLRQGIVLLTRGGSQAYGTATPTSDTDYRGIVIEPQEYSLGFVDTFEQAEFHDPDAAIFSLKKFMRLAADCNPNILEILYTDDTDHVIHPAPYRRTGEALELLLSHRDLFLSRRARYSFSGYAMAQLKRIRLHRRYLEAPPTHEPTRVEFGLPEKTAIPYDQLLAAEATIKKEVDALYNLDLDLDEVNTIKARKALDSLRDRVRALLAGNTESRVIGNGLGFNDNFLLLLDHERAYRQARTEWEHYQNWLACRNPARADLEARFGYDTKHAMHLVRLLRMGREILQGRGVIVKRPDAQELLEVRRGSLSYAQVLELAEREEAAMAQDYETSTLPHGPDRRQLQQLCISIHRSFYRD